MPFSVGSLVQARGREWVVLPESQDELLIVRPLGGTDDEIAGIDTRLEDVEAAQFQLPSLNHLGDAQSARLLRSAVRLGLRSSVGPFRSFARLHFEPRPYQLVPLLLALKQPIVRLLIADDVGIGKTVEALLIARELLDRGEIDRLAVLCPPQLAEQWQAELSSKFAIEAELVLSSTAARLERHLRLGESLFERYPFVVVSTDFIKSERRRLEFLRTAPSFVIVDEAHAVAYGLEARGNHQRHATVAALAENSERHLVLVTATPHSGQEDAFRSLLAMLNPRFADLPSDLSGPTNEPLRREIARHLVQRRRADIRAYLDAVTPFPEREAAEATYRLTEDHKHLFDRALAYARETVRLPGDQLRQRVRWWSALALLRALASSPAAAAATLRSRAASAQAETVEEADDLGELTVLDRVDGHDVAALDIIPGSDPDSAEAAQESPSQRRRLLDMARQAEALQGKGDAKLQTLIPILRQLIDEGFQPIVFCRFIPTVSYLVEALRPILSDVEIVGVDGTLPPAEREMRVEQLSCAPRRLLICTDCLSEGINLQHSFDAVIHYDLSWNPTRHEQREGRVDRYGQPSPRVKVLTYYGIDNQIDGLVLEVLLRKHQTIRSTLGVSVPVPGSSEDLIQAIFEGLLLREGGNAQLNLPGLEEYIKPRQRALALRWEASAEREKQSRTMFAQHSVKVEEVAEELKAARAAIGLGVDVQDFVRQALARYRAPLSPRGSAWACDLREAPRGLRDLLGLEQFIARFELPVRDGELYLTRTHPLVEKLAAYVVQTALDEVQAESSGARRAGVMRTRAVPRRTTLLLLRLRFQIQQARGSRELLAEESLTVAFEGSPQQPTWLPELAVEALLNAEPDENIQVAQARHFLQRLLDDFEPLQPALESLAHERAQALLAAHQRVRHAAHRAGDRQPPLRVQPLLPLDVLGVYLFLPVAGAS